MSDLDKEIEWLKEERDYSSYAIEMYEGKQGTWRGLTPAEWEHKNRSAIKRLKELGVDHV